MAEHARCVIIVGMHRSGTSLLAGSLQAAGLHLGNVSNSDPYNLKGNQESVEIRALNDRILARAGYAWNRPPAGQAVWSAAEFRDAAAIIAPFEMLQVPWGFKDPRTVWTLAGWTKLIPQATIVSVFRHPSLVAKSLASRPGALNVSYDDGLRLWEMYNTELLRLSEQTRFPLLRFTADVENFMSAVDRFCARVGLTSSPRKFYAPDLVQQREAIGALPASVQRLYDRLCEASVAQQF